MRARIAATASGSALLFCSALLLTAPGLLVVSVAFLTAAPQESGSRQYRAGVDLIRLDVSVVDPEGRPIRGLGVGDFTVIENGRVQEIETFSEVDVPSVQPHERGNLGPGPDVSRNDSAPEQRLFVIVMDDATVPFDPHFVQLGKRIGRGVIERLGPSDLAAVVFTRDSRYAQDFTHDRQRLISAIESFSAGVSPLPFESSAKTMILATEFLADIPDRRKVLVLISVGIPVDVETMGTIVLGQGGTSRREEMLRLNDLMRESIRQAQAANVNIYAIDPSGVGGLGPYFMSRGMRPLEAFNRAKWYSDSLKVFSENTGGRAVTSTNDPVPSLDGIFEENSFYYLLGFVSNNAAEGGATRRVQVKVNRREARVRARSSYSMTADVVPTPGSASSGSFALTRAMTGVLPTRGLPLRVAAIPFASPESGDAHVGVIVGVSGLRRIGGSPDVQRIDVAIEAFTTEGRSRARDRIETTLRVPGASTGETGFEVASTLALEPGRYRLRVAAVSREDGRHGSVYHDVDVPDFKGAALSLSGLALAVTPPPVPAGSSSTLPWRLPVSATTHRTFDRGAAVMAFLRVYQNARRPPAPVQAVITIIDSTGHAVVRSVETLPLLRFTTGHSAELRWTIPTAELKPGRYLLSVTATKKNDAAQRALWFDLIGSSGSQLLGSERE